MNIILASTSPFRKAQLERLSISFNTESPEVDEDVFKNENFTPKELSKILSYEKAKAIFDKYKDQEICVIGGDQVLSFENQILGKPGDKENALKQLTMLSGKTHELITSICILTKDKKVEYTEIARMTMRDLNKSQLQRYIDRDNPVNTCGSYKLEEAGISLFSKIDCEDYTSIIGMPLIFMTETLASLGIEIP